MSRQACEAVPITPGRVSAQDKAALIEKRIAAVAAAAGPQQGTLAWLEARKWHITASDVGAVCGNNPYKDARKVVADKVAEEEGVPRPPPNVHMLYGSLTEGPVRAALEQHLGVTIKQRRLARRRAARLNRAVARRRAA
jgi:predicted phage-related endonuclease